jgi:hypothetical protein
MQAPTTSQRATHFSDVKNGNNCVAACTSSHALVAQNAAARKAFHRFSSEKSDISVRRSGVAATFEVCLAQRPASGGPAFLAPICREAVAH